MTTNAKLISRADLQESYEVGQLNFSIGRSEECTVIVRDPLVSRVHARINYQNKNYVIENLGRNPLRLNGAPIHKQVLNNGDLLTIGNEEFIFKINSKPDEVFEPHPSNGETIINTASSGAVAFPKLSINTSLGDNLSFKLDKSTYLIGRQQDCDICLDDSTVSRRHAEIYRDDTGWRIRDLESGNGTLLNGSLIDDKPLPEYATLQLGVNGPAIFLRFEGTSKPVGEPADSIQDISERYFSDTATNSAGEHTMLVRQVFQQVRKKQSQKYLYIIGTIACLFVISSAIGLYNYVKLKKAREVAVEIFYNMRALSIQVATIEDRLQEIGQSKLLEEEIVQKKEQLLSLEEQYDRFIKESGIISMHLSKEDRIIYRIARIFGECEVNMPKAFKQEIKNYIEKWQKSPRLIKAIQRLETNNYAPIITKTMVANGLPPHFLYLALQESDFRKKAVGPKTRHGIAKGIWQFIPQTAQEYGLRVGPLANTREYDPVDERFNFSAATSAAGKFLRDLYKTDAQASGLLVMASYNWGPTRVKKRIRQMPMNPKERNFWRLIKDYKIPIETKDYVFYIFSATVICENPELFGFNFKNPLSADEGEVRG
jgi:pSer/pThr/pTyr-binding forkhead associated (FHA) protein/soluble lytic murein transglycosylase-like protein